MDDFFWLMFEWRLLTFPYKDYVTRLMGGTKASVCSIGVELLKAVVVQDRKRVWLLAFPKITNTCMDYCTG